MSDQETVQDAERKYVVCINSNRQWNRLTEYGIEDRYQCYHVEQNAARKVALQLSRSGEITCVLSGEDEFIHVIYDNGNEYAPVV